MAGSCGICGRANAVREGVVEVLEIINVGSGVHYFRCRKHLNNEVTQEEAMSK